MYSGSVTRSNYYIVLLGSSRLFHYTSYRYTSYRPNPCRYCTSIHGGTYCTGMVRLLRLRKEDQTRAAPPLVADAPRADDLVSGEMYQEGALDRGVSAEALYTEMSAECAQPEGRSRSWSREDHDLDKSKLPSARELQRLDDALNDDSEPINPEISAPGAVVSLLQGGPGLSSLREATERSGFMLKKSGAFSGYRKRFFVLKEGGCCELVWLRLGYC